MQRHVSERKQPLVRTAVYTFMTLTVTTIVALLTLVVLGYSFNQQDGRLEQGGLLQFNSIPSGATVTLDEMTLGSRTGTKSTVSVGNHSVSFDLDGYRTWKKTINIMAGEIGWLSYARMIPTTVTPQTVRTFPALNSSLASPKHNYILLHESADQPTFVQANIQNDKVQYTTISLPVAGFTAPAAGKTKTFTIDSWSQDEQAALIRHTYDDSKTEWLLLNRGSPERSININATFAVAPIKLQFAGTGNRLLFVQTDDIVRRINLDEQTLSRPLASRVADFTDYDDKTITYATTPDDKSQRSIGYAAVDIADPQTIATYPADGQPLYGTMATYFSQRYVAIVHGQTLTIQSGTLPTKNNKGTLKKITTATLPAGSTSLEMSLNSRFAIIQLPDGYATYDIELNKYDKTTWAYQSAVPRGLNWLDNYILWSDYGGQLRIYDFDGANQQTIMPVSEGFTATISPNDKFIYGVNKTDKGFELRRAQLVQ